MDNTIEIHMKDIFLALKSFRKLNQSKPGRFESLPRTMVGKVDFRKLQEENNKLRKKEKDEEEKI